MRASHLHPLCRNLPRRLRKTDFRASHVANVSWPCHGKRQEQESGAERRPTVVLVDTTHHSAEPCFVRNGRAMLHLGPQKRALQRVRGSLVALSVTIASRKSLPIAPRRRRADSRPRLFSTFFKRSRISAGVISLIGRLASGAARSSRSQRFLSIVVGAAPFASGSPSAQ